MSKVAYIKDGQFRDIYGAVVPAVFGDAEQIKLLRAYNEFNEDPPSVEFSAVVTRITYRGEFNCACGELVELSNVDYNVTADDINDLDDDDIAKELNREKGVCRRCGASYQLIMDRNREFSIKLLKPSLK